MDPRSLLLERTASILALGAALLLMAAPAVAQNRRDKDKKKPPLPDKIQPWMGDFDSGAAHAKERNSPLIVLGILEGEETSDRVRDEIYKSKEFLKASVGTVVLLVNNGNHPRKTIKEKTEKGEEVERQVCSVFETPACEDHKRSWNRVYQEFHIEGEMKMPHILAVLPNGKIHGRYMDEIENNQALSLLAESKAAAGPSLSNEELLEVRAKLDTGASSEKAHLWSLAWKAYVRVLEITETSTYADRARVGSKRALDAMQGEIDHGLKWLEEGRVEEGYARLLQLQKDFAATPLEKPLKGTLRKVVRDKRYADIIKAIKRRAAAEELWTKCMKAMEEDKVKSAERHAATLIKKFRDTPAGQKAVERFPHLVPVEE